MDAWTIEPYGSRAWLVRFGDELSAGVLAHAVAVARALEASPPAGLREFTMGYATVLLEFGVEIEEERVREIADVLQSLPARRMHAAPRRVDIPVVYDGEDLPAVARHTGMDEAEVIRRHSGRDYRGLHILALWMRRCTCRAGRYPGRALRQGAWPLPACRRACIRVTARAVGR